MSTDSSNYSPEFSENKAVGIVWGTKVDYATWFGANVEFIHCIQMIPFTPISEELLPYCWIKEEYQVLKQADKRQTRAHTTVEGLHHYGPCHHQPVRSMGRGFEPD